MKLISHRGNTNGPQKYYENEPSYIIDTLMMGYDVEIDVWVIDNRYYLGHDKPTYLISEIFLENRHIWCHAKNIEALCLMLKNKLIHCFWHQTDEVTITSRGIIWAYPRREPIPNSIYLFPEKFNHIPNNILGICSDYISEY